MQLFLVRCIPGIHFSNCFLYTKVAQMVDAYILEIEVHKAYCYEIDSKPVGTEPMKGGNGDYGP